MLQGETGRTPAPQEGQKIEAGPPQDRRQPVTSPQRDHERVQGPCGLRPPQCANAAHEGPTRIACR